MANYLRDLTCEILYPQHKFMARPEINLVTWSVIQYVTHWTRPQGEALVSVLYLLYQHSRGKQGAIEFNKERNPSVFQVNT